MCLGIPMQISSFSENSDHVAHCIQGGIGRDVNVYLLQDKQLSVGDYVLVHVGYAIQLVDADYSQESQSLFENMSKAEHIKSAESVKSAESLKRGDL